MGGWVEGSADWVVVWSNWDCATPPVRRESPREAWETFGGVVIHITGVRPGCVLDHTNNPAAENGQHVQWGQEESVKFLTPTLAQGGPLHRQAAVYAFNGSHIVPHGLQFATAYVQVKQRTVSSVESCNWLPSTMCG